MLRPRLPLDLRGRLCSQAELNSLAQLHLFWSHKAPLVLGIHSLVSTALSSLPLHRQRANGPFPLLYMFVQNDYCRCVFLNLCQWQCFDSHAAS